MLKKCWPKKFVYSWCVLSDLIFMQIFHRVMQMDNIGWEPFETPTIPKIGNGSMGKQWRFLFGICQEATKIALDLTVQKAGYGLTLTVVSNSTSFANTVCSLFFLSLYHCFVFQSITISLRQTKEVHESNDRWRYSIERGLIYFS